MFLRGPDPPPTPLYVILASSRVEIDFLFIEVSLLFRRSTVDIWWLMLSLVSLIICRISSRSSVPCLTQREALITSASICLYSETTSFGTMTISPPTLGAIFLSTVFSSHATMLGSVKNVLFSSCRLLISQTLSEMNRNLYFLFLVSSSSSTWGSSSARLGSGGSSILSSGSTIIYSKGFMIVALGSLILLKEKAAFFSSLSLSKLAQVSCC